MGKLKGPGLAAKLEESRARREDDSPHLVITARAGCAKTTTLVAGMFALSGERLVDLVHTDQQQECIDAIARSRGKAVSVAATSFSDGTVEELRRKTPGWCSTQTVHSMGMRAIRESLSGGVGRGFRLEKDKTRSLLVEATGDDVGKLLRTRPDFLVAAEKLVALCKQNLVAMDEDDYGDYLSDSREGEERARILDELADGHGVHLEDRNTGWDFRDELYALIPQLLTESRNPAREEIDYNDMLWWPAVMNLPVYRNDLLLVDEGQDLNIAQQSLVKRAGKRLVVCGDDRQAVYHFMGADAHSLPRLADELSRSKRGCVRLKLTRSRRCSQAVAREAQELVPDFEAEPGNPEGSVSRMSVDALLDVGHANEPGGWPTTVTSTGDMIVCRVSGPLVRMCVRYLRAGIAAKVLGREQSGAVLALVKRLRASSPQEIVSGVRAWLRTELEKERAKTEPSDSRIIAILDRADVVESIASRCQDMEEFHLTVRRVFDPPDEECIRLSTIHRAKGLEADRVFFLCGKGAECPHPMARTPWQREQELNLRYVAITRAKRRLIYVT